MCRPSRSAPFAAGAGATSSGAAQPRRPREPRPAVGGTGPRRRAARRRRRRAAGRAAWRRGPFWRGGRSAAQVARVGPRSCAADRAQVQVGPRPHDSGAAGPHTAPMPRLRSADRPDRRRVHGRAARGLPDRRRARGERPRRRRRRVGPPPRRLHAPAAAPPRRAAATRRPRRRSASATPPRPPDAAIPQPEPGRGAGSRRAAGGDEHGAGRRAPHARAGAGRDPVARPGGEPAAIGARGSSCRASRTAASRRRCRSAGRGGKKGYVDADGNKWEWVPEGSGAAHGGAHWDVQHPGRLATPTSSPTATWSARTTSRTSARLRLRATVGQHRQQHERRPRHGGRRRRRRCRRRRADLVGREARLAGLRPARAGLRGGLLSIWTLRAMDPASIIAALEAPTDDRSPRDGRARGDRAGRISSPPRCGWRARRSRASCWPTCSASRPPPPASGALIAALHDRERQVRSAAADALGKVFLTHPDDPQRDGGGRRAARALAGRARRVRAPHAGRGARRDAQPAPRSPRWRPRCRIRRRRAARWRAGRSSSCARR